MRERAARASASKQSVRISSKQLTRFFDATLWNGDFSDGPNGFYAIYRTLFGAINESEMYAMAPAGEPALPFPPVKYPSFGNSYLQYDGTDGTLKTFYTAFMNFNSRRPFNEVDQYRLQDAPDRRVRRLMEKENKRARDDARKDYNEAVRSLASFLKKRDPRFLNSTSSDPLRVKQLERQKLQAQLRDAAREAARKREENAKSYQEQDWQKVSVNETDSESSADGGSDGQDEEAGIRDAGQPEEGDDEDVQDWFCPACEKDFASQGAWDNHALSKKHLKNMEKLKRDMQKEEDELGLSHTDLESLSLDTPDDGLSLPVKSRKDKKRGKRKGGFEPDLDVAQDLQEAPDATAVQWPSVADPQVQNGDQEGKVAATTSAVPELSKRDKRRAREAAKKASGTTTPPVETCNVCQECFSSRTKLFSHIKDTGHAAAQEVNGRGGRKSKK